MSDDSSLPPLKPKNLNSDVNNSQSSSESMTPETIRREISKLYPQIQQLEKDIKSIQSKIPSNLSKTILALSQDVQKVRSQRFPPSTDSSNDGKKGIQSCLDDLESQLMKQLEDSIKKSSSDLENRLIQLIHEQEGLPQNSIPINNEPEEQESSIDPRIQALEQMIKKQQEKNQQRLSLVENNLAKFALVPSNKDDSGTLRQISKEIDSQRTQICQLKTRIDNIQESLSKPTANQQSQYQIPDIDYDSIPQTKVINSSDSQQDEFDEKLENSINQIKNRIESFRDQYSEALNELQTKADECDDRMRAVNQTAIDLITTTSQLDSRIVEVENLTSSLQSRIQEITGKIDNESNEKSIEVLANKLQQLHQNIRSEISSIQERIKKCQQSLSSTPEI